MLAGVGIAITLLLIVPILCGAVLLTTPFHVVNDVFTSIRFGVVDGYENGLFFHVVKRALLEVTVFSKRVQDGIAIVNDWIASRQAQNGLNAEAMDGLYQQPNQENFSDLIDVPRSANPDPGLRDPQQDGVTFMPLTAEELHLARGVATIEVVLEQYKSLFERLEKLDQAIAARGDGTGELVDIDDEVVSFMAVTKPALLVKLYENTSGQWRVVPPSTLFSDEKNLEDLFKGSLRHPHTRDLILTPNSYEGNKTRYCIQSYENLTSVQELREAAEIIRKKLVALRPENLPSVSNFISNFADQIGQTFWSRTPREAAAVAAIARYEAVQRSVPAG